MTHLSRSLRSSPSGAMYAELPKVRVSDETLEGATRLARAAGMTLSEWVRTLVEIRVHSLDMMQALHMDRLKSVADWRTNLVQKIHTLTSDELLPLSHR